MGIKAQIRTSVLDTLSYCWEVRSFEQLILAWMDSVASGAGPGMELLGFFCFEENRA